jgi:hypothetical protein
MMHQQLVSDAGTDRIAMHKISMGKQSASHKAVIASAAPSASHLQFLFIIPL